MVVYAVLVTDMDHNDEPALVCRYYESMGSNKFDSLFSGFITSLKQFSTSLKSSLDGFKLGEKCVEIASSDPYICSVISYNEDSKNMKKKAERILKEFEKCKNNGGIPGDFVKTHVDPLFGYRSKN